MIDPPLLRVFLELQRRGFKLGVSDYLGVVRALAAGFGTESPEALAFVCATLWAKSRKDQVRIERLVTRTLRSEAQAARTTAASEDEPEDQGRPEPRSWLRRAIDSLRSSKKPREAAGEAPEAPSAPRAEPVPRVEAPEQTPIELGQLDTTTQYEIPLDLLGGAPEWALNPDFELEAQRPVNVRRMKRAWRGYRRAGRSGPKTEFDMDTALDRLQRHGILATLPMRSPRSNRARLLLLVDQGGSMVPFRYISAALIGAARGSGLGTLVVGYFHDVPGDKVYLEPSRRLSRPLDEVSKSFVDQGIMVYGDGGAARRQLDERRVEATAGAIARLRRVTPTVVWLNPVPAKRWAGTSAAEIRSRTGVPMFPMHEGGLRAAVGALHGKSG